MGLRDRAKAKFVKANGYLEKPFSQGDLLKIIFQHIVWKFINQVNELHHGCQYLSIKGYQI